MNVDDFFPRPGVSRRSLLIGATAGMGAVALGASWASEARAAAAYIKGADVSWVPQMEAQGFSWNDKNGVKRDILSILKGYGMTAVRLRTWVDPSDSPTDGHCSIAETADMALRCQDAGLRVMISYHFGDTWNSVGTQKPPKAWASMTYAQMKTAMADYVASSTRVLKNRGVTPTWFALGNETNKGICGSVGSVSRPAQMTGLIMTAYDGVKAAFPNALTVLHLAQPQKLASIQAFLNGYRDNGGKWDITGLSSYAQGGNVAGVLANMKTVMDSYAHPMMHVEAGGPVAKPAATKASLIEMMTGLKAMGALGSLYWEPQGYAPFTDYDMTAWDGATRQPTIALDAFNEV